MNDVTPRIIAVSILISARRALSALHPAQNVLRVALWSVIDDLTGAELDAALFLVKVDCSRALL